MTRSTTRDAEMRERAAQVIPRGMYGHQSTKWLPDEYPQFFSRAAGARLWDVDGNEYIDFMCAYGPNLLGYGDATVEAAAAAQQRAGRYADRPVRPRWSCWPRRWSAWSATPTGRCSARTARDATSMAIVTARAQTRPQQDHHGATAPITAPRPGARRCPAGITPEDKAHLDLLRLQRRREPGGGAEGAGEGDVAGVFATPFRHETFK